MLLAQLAHELGFFLHHNQLALANHANAVCHVFGLFNVVGGEDDGGAGLAQRPHHAPHVVAQLHVHTRAGLVQKQNFGLVRQRLGDQHAALHAARERQNLAVFFVPERQVFQNLLDVGRVGRLAKQTPAEAHGGPHGFKRIGVQLLGHQANDAAGCAVVVHGVKAVGLHRALRGVGHAANNADERGFACAVGAEQGENFAAVDVQVNVLEGLKAAGVGLANAAHADDGVGRVVFGGGGCERWKHACIVRLWGQPRGSAAMRACAMPPPGSGCLGLAVARVLGFGLRQHAFKQSDDLRLLFGC